MTLDGENGAQATPIYILIGIFIGFVVIGILLLAFGLEKNKEKETNVDDNIASTVSLVSITPTSGMDLCLSSFRTLKKPTMFLVIPLSYSSALVQAIIFAEFNQVLVSKRSLIFLIV